MHGYKTNRRHLKIANGFVVPYLFALPLSNYRPSYFFHSRKVHTFTLSSTVRYIMTSQPLTLHRLCAHSVVTGLKQMSWQQMHWNSSSTFDMNFCEHSKQTVNDTDHRRSVPTSTERVWTRKSRTVLRRSHKTDKPEDRNPDDFSMTVCKLDNRNPDDVMP